MRVSVLVVCYEHGIMSYDLMVAFMVFQGLALTPFPLILIGVGLGWKDADKHDRGGGAEMSR